MKDGKEKLIEDEPSLKDSWATVVKTVQIDISPKPINLGFIPITH